MPASLPTRARRRLTRAHTRLAEAGRRVNVNDLWIAACAASRELPVVTQDDDYEPLAGIAGLQVLRC